MFTQAIIAESKKYNLLLSNIQDVIIFIQPDGSIIEANQAVQSLYGYVPEEVPAMSIYELVHPHIVIDFKQILQNAAQEAKWFSSIHLKKNGQSFPVEVYYRQVLIQEQGFYLVIIRDASHSKGEEAITWKMNRYDHVTGLPNRKMFEDKCELALRQAKRNKTRLAIFSIQLNNLVEIYNSRGYSKSNQILRELGLLLQDSLGLSEGVYYLYGNQFAILSAQNGKSPEIEKIAQDIIMHINQFSLLIYVNVSISIGVAAFPDDGETMEQLYNKSEIALANARRASKNDYQLYHPSMSNAIQERAELEKGLRRSLEKNEFLLYYQPYVDLKNMQMTGMEALVRWVSPERGLVAPNIFIPLAEQSGLIVPLGEYILREACQQNKRWQDMGFPAIPVAVNISTRQFYEKNFVATVKEILDDTGLNPEYLTLEITESIMIERMEECAATLASLAEWGIKISLDDFGTGYSSLSYLQQLPIHTLKIDKSFVDGLATESLHEGAIVRAIINMAHNMDLFVIAEGVEDWQQLNYLALEKCDIGQGYYFSPPLTAELMEKTWMDSRVLKY